MEESMLPFDKVNKRKLPVQWLVAMESCSTLLLHQIEVLPKECLICFEVKLRGGFH